MEGRKEPPNRSDQSIELAGILQSVGEVDTIATSDIPDAPARDLYQHDIILLRPDMHIVWRGNRLPDDVRDIAATATGH